MSKNSKPFRDIRQDLRDRLKNATARVEKLTEESRRIQLELNEADLEKRAVERLLEIEEMKWKRGQVEVETVDDRFAGMMLRDACLTLLDEDQKWTLLEMERALRKGSFVFTSEYPGREIHMALVGLQVLGKAKRLDSGLWIKPDIGER